MISRAALLGRDLLHVRALSRGAQPPQQAACLSTRGGDEEDRDKRLVLSRIIRVDHAMETLASSLIEGQKAVLGGHAAAGSQGGDGGDLGDGSAGEALPSLEALSEGEKDNIRALQGAMVAHRGRPSLLLPALAAAGYLAGVGTAALGARPAAVAAEAAGAQLVEVANDGLREIREAGLESNAELRSVLRQVRDTPRGAGVEDAAGGYLADMPTSPQEALTALREHPEPGIAVLRWGVGAAGKLATMLAAKV